MKLKFNFNIAGSIVAVGFSTFIIEVSDAIVIFILNNVLLIYTGEEAVIIFGIITKISMFLFITVIGISSAMQPIAAYNYGQENYDKVKEVVTKTIKWVTISSVIMWLVNFIFAPNILGIFMRDKELLWDTVRYFRIVISVFPCVGVYFVAIYYYQAMGEAKSSFVLSIYRQIIIFIPVLLIMMPLAKGIMGASLSYPISDLISAVTGIYYINKALRGEEGLITQEL